MTTTDLSAILFQWQTIAEETAAPAGHSFDQIATRYATIQARIAPLRTFPPSFDSNDLDTVLAQLHSARRMRRQIIEGNEMEVIVPTLRAFLFDEEPLEQKFTTYPALIRYAGLPILGELFGWVHADRYPLYTQRALTALRRLGWEAPARNYPIFNAAFSALRQTYEGSGLRLAPQLPLNLEIDQFLAWVSMQPAGTIPAAGRDAGRTAPAAIREYGAPYHPGPRRSSAAAKPLVPGEQLFRSADAWPDAPLEPPSPEQFAAAERVIRAQLALPPDVVRRAAAHLVAGRHLVLTGAPGTGKSHLAQLLARELFGYEPMLVTATAEWSAFDVVGGLVPTTDEQGNLHYTIRPGYVYEALQRNWLLDSAGQPRRDSDGRLLRRPVPGTARGGSPRGLWLIIDELNRADVDKAFGELFSALEVGTLRVPQPGASGTALIPFPQDFRIIATLNTRDRHFLFTLSDALKRRFAFLELAPPDDPAEERAVLLERARAGLSALGLHVPDETLPAALDPLLRFTLVVRGFHPLGGGPVLAALRYVGAAQNLAGTAEGKEQARSRRETSLVRLLDEAVVAEILPQLESLRELALALLADLAAGRRTAILPRLERELFAAGTLDASVSQTLAGLGRALRTLAEMDRDDEARAAAETLLAAMAALPDLGGPDRELVAALRALHAPAERLLPELTWPLVAAQLEAWLAERMR